MRDIVEGLSLTKGRPSSGFCDGVMNAILMDLSQRRAQLEDDLKSDHLLDIDGPNSAIETMLFLSQLLTINEYDVAPIIFVLNYIDGVLKSKINPAFKLANPLAEDLVKDFRVFFLYYADSPNDVESWKYLPYDEKIKHVLLNKRFISKGQGFAKLDLYLSKLNLRLISLGDNHSPEKDRLESCKAKLILKKESVEKIRAKEVVDSFNKVNQYMNIRSIIDICFLFQDGLYSCRDEGLNVEREAREDLYGLDQGFLEKTRLGSLAARNLNFEILNTKLPAVDYMLLSVYFDQEKLRKIFDFFVGCGDDVVIRIATPVHVSGVVIKGDGTTYIINETYVTQQLASNIDLGEVLDGHEVNDEIPLAHIQVCSVKGVMKEAGYILFSDMQEEDIGKVREIEDDNPGLQMIGGELDTELDSKCFSEYAKERDFLIKSGCKEASNFKLALMNKFLKAVEVISSKYQCYMSSYLSRNESKRKTRCSEIQARLDELGYGPSPLKRSRNYLDNNQASSRSPTVHF